jgi:hypothetical protein
VEVMTDEILSPTIAVHDFVHCPSIVPEYTSLQRKFGTDFSNPSVQKIFPNPLHFRKKRVSVNVIKPIDETYLGSSLPGHQNYLGMFWTRGTSRDDAHIHTDPKSVVVHIQWPGLAMDPAACKNLYQQALDVEIEPDTKYVVGKVLLTTHQKFICFPTHYFGPHKIVFPYDGAFIRQLNKELHLMRRFQISGDEDIDEDGVVW